MRYERNTSMAIDAVLRVWLLACARITDEAAPRRYRRSDVTSAGPAEVASSLPASGRERHLYRSRRAGPQPIDRPALHGSGRDRMWTRGRQRRDPLSTDDPLLPGRVLRRPRRRGGCGRGGLARGRGRPARDREFAGVVLAAADSRCGRRNRRPADLLLRTRGQGARRSRSDGGRERWRPRFRSDPAARWVAKGPSSRSLRLSVHRSGRC